MRDTLGHLRRTAGAGRSVAALLTAVAAATGCQSAGTSSAGLEIWAGGDVGPGVPTARAPGLYDENENCITLAGAIKEALSCCLVLSSPRGSAGRLEVTVTDLANAEARIPDSAVRLFRVHDVELQRYPGWYLRTVEPQERVTRVADVLVPAGARRGGLPARVGPGRPLAVWMDLNIPEGTPPGTYLGWIRVHAGERVLRAVALRVTVWPFALPDAPGVALLAEVDHQRLFAHHVFVDGRPHAPPSLWGDDPAAAQLDGVLASTTRLLASHGVTAVLPGLTPNAKVDADLALSLDWSDYDRVVAPLLDGQWHPRRLPVPLCRVPFSEKFPPPPSYGPLTSPAYSRLATQYLAACAGHFADRGWLDRAFVVLPHVGTPGPEAYRAVRHFGRIVHNADPALAALAPMFPQDMAGYGWEGFTWEDVSSFVDIWAPKAQFFDPQEMRRQRGAGKRTFWQLDRPPFSGSVALCARPADTRVIGWQARRYGVEAVLLPAANRWPGPRQTATPQACCEGERAPLIYPGRSFQESAPLPSVRLKRLRRSMQDVAYLTLLDELGLGHVGAALAEALAPGGGSDAYGAHFGDPVEAAWVADAGLWATARQIMADEILRATAGEAPPSGPPSAASASADTVAGTVQWRLFMEATRSLDLRVDGVRVRPQGPDPAGVVEVVVPVTLANHTRKPVSGRMTFEDLPISWEAEAEHVEVPEISPGESRRVTLRARAAVMETGPGAVRYLPLALRTSDDRVYPFAARLGYLTAPPLQQALTIDGDLRDWPAAVGNAAEDFILITGEDPQDTGRPQARPTHDTQCFVAADQEAVYFAFGCPVEGAAALPSGLRNFVRYEDGVPAGEELVELLIDPANAGTRSTGDLYHVVIKPQGWFCERGIGTDPPTGKRQPWAADVSAAVKVHSDRWVAEVRIPRSAFGPPSPARQIWGLNITRFDLARQEFSNWAGATGNAYDPLSLGNLALP